MVVFVLTRPGFEEMISFIRKENASVWINEGVLSDEETAELRSTGVDLTNFTSRINPVDEEGINRSIDIISEHHPGQRIWVERQS